MLLSATVVAMNLHATVRTIVTIRFACYCPHNSSNESEIDTFYIDVRAVLDFPPAQNFNAKYVLQHVPFTFNSETNGNGKNLIDLMEEF